MLPPLLPLGLVGGVTLLLGRFEGRLGRPRIAADREGRVRRRRGGGPGYSALWRLSRSGSIGALRAGRLKLAVRWKTCRCLACWAINGIICTPEEPVPITQPGGR